MRDGHPIPAEFDRLQTPSSAYAPRRVVTYLCAREHLVAIPFAAEAEVPEAWECRCGQPANLVTTAGPAGPAELAAP
ncbi:MAG TPA: RNA polymerase-binding protein RbpA [Actinomycetes bacterium]